MDSQASERERRTFDRHNCRLPCTLKAHGESATGIVVDVSARGLFVQTKLVIAPGEEVLLSIRELGGDATMDVQATAARQRKAHRSLVSADPSGVGLEIKAAPEAYFALVSELT